MKRLLMLGVLALGACAHDTPPPVYITRSCVPDDVPGPPEYADDDEAVDAAPGAPQRLQLRLTANEQRKARLAVVEPVVRGCRG